MEFCIVVNHGTPVLIRAIVIDYLVSPLDDKYRKELLSLPHLKNLNLDHPYTGNNLFQVYILIGADHYWHFIGDEKPVRVQGPTAVSSRVGYLVSGALNSVKVKKPTQSISLNIQAVDGDDCSYMWSLETLGIFPHQENVKETADYAKSSIQCSNGQYIARFPWKMDHGELPTNYKMVQNMTRAIIKRLYRDEILSVFATLIQEQLDSQLIERVPPEQLTRIAIISRIISSKRNRQPLPFESYTTVRTKVGMVLVSMIVLRLGPLYRTIRFISYYDSEHMR